MKEKFKDTLVIIPARGGSKRIPEKNIKLIFGQPMIFWPLSTLSKLFFSENILVSTDSDKIKAIVETKNLKTSYKRPAYLSDDFTGTVDVVTHALKWYEKNMYKVKFVLTVYPTALMLSMSYICEAMTILKNDKKCDSIMSATNFSFPIQRAVYEDKQGYVKMFEPNNYSVRSQDLIEAKHDAGQFYLSRVEAVRSGKILTDSVVKLHLLNQNKVIDIDTPEDFKIAEERLKLYKDRFKKKKWKFLRRSI